MGSPDFTGILVAYLVVGVVTGVVIGAGLYYFLGT